MAEGRGTAADRLGRLLYLLPAAAERTLSLAEAAETLGVAEAVVAADLAEVIAREFYHPAGGTGDLRVSLEADRVRVHSTRLGRPVALDTEESLATLVALRRYAASLPAGERDEADELVARVAAHVATSAPAEEAERIVVRDADPAGFRALLRRASADRRVCRIAYLRPGDAEETHRDLHPYVLVYAQGDWSVVGYCGLRRDVRVFRLDRILEADVTPEVFELPSDFRLDDYVREGGVFRPDSAVDATVRYRGAAARRRRNETGEDGADVLDVEYQVADPDWLVRHVLRHGGDAEVIAPAELRRAVREAAERLSRRR